MASVNDLGKSKFLKRSDVGQGVLVTIESVRQQIIEYDGDSETKWCLTFKELDKPMVLNKTNGQIIAMITGHSDNIETAWVGTQVVLYDDPTVSFAGELKGGIRVRAPKNVVKDDLPF